ncbi:hypothetical protein PISMIDRAFT_684273 [Pisolithus microcarpus 441]|uniref:Uncharacterized protein n=1 Tax=Pisolithus microcarpus 441 TaxID=765257 RepID=A0A0C9Y0Z2_9AGAM|nr:hypothetical protein PISMIDRAFT_684273 [Pisolithus microcarpus 441]
MDQIYIHTYILRGVSTTSLSIAVVLASTAGEILSPRYDLSGLCTALQGYGNSLKGV